MKGLIALAALAAGSCGTGAAIAANFAAIGTGTDTGQAIRSPASGGSLVDLRPTRGLVSRDGIIPASTTQDATGPITRTVEDAARMLDVMAGYGPNDPITAFSLDKIPASFTHRSTPMGWPAPALACSPTSSAPIPCTRKSTLLRKPRSGRWPRSGPR